jgi:hypothetical protein
MERKKHLLMFESKYATSPAISPLTSPASSSKLKLSFTLLFVLSLIPIDANSGISSGYCTTHDNPVVNCQYSVINTPNIVAFIPVSADDITDSATDITDSVDDITDSATEIPNPLSDNTDKDLPGYSQKIYKAYVSGNMALWEEIVKEMETDLHKNTTGDISKIEDHINLLNFYYGLSGYLTATGKKKKAEEYISKGQSMIEKLLSQEKSATIIAYKAAFMGFRIGLNRFSAIVLGPKSIALSKQAIEIDSLNTRALNERANVLYYSPSFAGGDKQEALRLYEKAIRVMRARSDTLNNWNYLSLLANTGQAFQREGETHKARHYYNLALQNEPLFKWVRDQLLPSIK